MRTFFPLVLRLGGPCHDRIHRTDLADEFDVVHSGFFLYSSLALVLRLGRSFVSVCNVLKGIKLHGFSETRIAALLFRGQAVVRQGPADIVTSHGPWTHWISFFFHQRREASFMPHGFLQSCSNIWRMTCSWWQLTHDITIHIIRLPCP